MRILLFFLSLILLISCENSTKESEGESEESKPNTQPQRPLAYENGKFFETNGTEMMYGGEDSSQHFDITNLELEKEQFHYGIGREKFPALLDPEFISVHEADQYWDDSARFLLAYSGDDVKAYSVKDLTRHEIVNDSLNGQPIMAAYCILADLGAIYDRTYGNKTLTFGLSGYTYFDEDVWDGTDGFVFWDRETESLWWPLIGKSVSGPLKGVELQVMDETHWEDTYWKKIRESYPNAKVLISGQDFERPQEWSRLEDVSGIVSNYQVSN